MASLATSRGSNKCIGLVATVLGGAEGECLLALLKHQSPALCLLCEHEELSVDLQSTHKS